MSIQLVDYNSTPHGVSKWVVSVAKQFPDGQCLVQQLFQGGVPMQSAFGLWTPVSDGADPLASAANFSECNALRAAVPLSMINVGVGLLSNSTTAASYISLRTSDWCVSAILANRNDNDAVVPTPGPVSPGCKGLDSLTFDGVGIAKWRLGYDAVALTVDRQWHPSGLSGGNLQVPTTLAGRACCARCCQLLVRSLIVPALRFPRLVQYPLSAGSNGTNLTTAGYAKLYYSYWISDATHADYSCGSYLSVDTLHHVNLTKIYVGAILHQVRERTTHACSLSRPCLLLSTFACF